MNSFVSIINSLNTGAGPYHCGFHECRTSEVMDRVERGLDDLGIVFVTEYSKGQMMQELRNRSIIFNHITYQTSHVYICRNHPLAGSREIDMEDLIQKAMNQNFVPVVDDQKKFIGIITRKSIIEYCYEKLKKAKEPID